MSRRRRDESRKREERAGPMQTGPVANATRHELTSAAALCSIKTSTLLPLLTSPRPNCAELILGPCCLGSDSREGLTGEFLLSQALHSRPGESTDHRASGYLCLATLIFKRRNHEGFSFDIRYFIPIQVRWL